MGGKMKTLYFLMGGEGSLLTWRKKIKKSKGDSLSLSPDVNLTTPYYLQFLSNISFQYKGKNGWRGVKARKEKNIHLDRFNGKK